MTLVDLQKLVRAVKNSEIVRHRVTKRPLLAVSLKGSQVTVVEKFQAVGRNAEEPHFYDVIIDDLELID